MNKVCIYTNRDGNICTQNIPFIKKREGLRRYDIYGRHFNPVTMQFEEVRLYELSSKVRSEKAASKVASKYILQMASMLVWFNVTKDFVNKKAANEDMKIVWRRTY